MHIDMNEILGKDELPFSLQLSQAYKGLDNQHQKHQFFEVIQDAKTGEGEVHNTQKGIVRSSCLDCLDRTNVMQQELVWQWLSAYLASPDRGLNKFLERPKTLAQETSGWGDVLGMFGSSPASSEPELPHVHSLIRNMWADLGDALSVQYTGAGSTLGAVLRAGGRSTYTLFDKGWNSVSRAFNSTFSDASRQAALELMTTTHKLPRLANPKGTQVQRAKIGNINVAMISWNAHGLNVWESPGVVELLLGEACMGEPGCDVDIIVLGVQEIIPLTVSAMVTHAAGDEVYQTDLERRFLKTIPVVL